jgi:MYXO-CTERM domain-containing protein
MQTILRALAVLGLMYFGFTSSAKADTTYNVTVASVAGVTAACAASNSGTFTTFTSGGVLLEVPTASTAGCYVGNYSGTPSAPTPNGLATTFIPGLNTEGTAAGLNALTTGWYAEFGAICGGTGQCTASNDSSNSNSSGDIDVLLNSSNASQTFQVYDNVGNIDTANNTAATGCSYTGGGTGGHATFTVAANTICFEDLSTGGSIAMTIGAPSVPEPSSVAFVGLGVLGAAEWFRRRRKAKAV